jgi:hypothetical protein
LPHELLLEIGQGLKRSTQDDQPSRHGKHQLDQAGPYLRPYSMAAASCMPSCLHPIYSE